MWQNLYLVRVWKQSKGILIFILFFAGLQFLFSFKRMVAYPFIVWNMYSFPQDIRQSGSIIAFYLDGKRIDQTRLPNWQEETALHTFNLYRRLREHPDADPMDEMVQHRSRFFPNWFHPFLAERINNPRAAAERYPDWLFFYMRKNTQTYFHKLEVKELFYVYQDGEIRATGEAYTHLVVQHE